MKRVYDKRARFSLKQFGTVPFAIFVVFVAFKILTPPSDELAQIDAPDGTRTARLRQYFYYNNQPSYKIYYRDAGKAAWLGLYHLPAYTNLPPEKAEPSMAWSEDSTRLDFLMNGTSIWHHVFQTR